ncbi:hypothetical protein ACE1AT_00935 [Pelatocladus sp. BLCC-F211]|uniref:hypothetical protein n=1 Tax=Pelatocladus sp. BLCC-F211 TaxID=3342752 RepID=UPI0035BB262D
MIISHFISKDENLAYPFLSLYETTLRPPMRRGSSPLASLLKKETTQQLLVVSLLLITRSKLKKAQS